MSRTTRAGAVFLLILCAGGAPRAATFDARPMSEDSSLIVVQGNLEPGDEKKFIDVALSTSNAVVVLNSNGGSLVAGIEIGKAIRLKGFTTLVPSDAQCASACASAWLGGRVRAMSDGAKIGFHAASFKENGQITSAGNALVGAYLNQLALPTTAIIYISETPPGEIRWLTFADAEQQGIEVRKLEIPSGQKKNIITSPETSTNPPPTNIENNANNFLADYCNNMSLNTDESMNYIDLLPASSLS
jgi:hypothetical protein